MFVWAHPPNWSDGFEVTLRYLTEILESRRGKEQRIAKRFRPRMTFEFTSLARRGLFTQVQRELFQELRNEIVVPFWPDRCTVGETVPSAAVSLTVSEVRPWMQPGKLLCIVQPGRGEARTITEILGSTITLDAPLDHLWDANSSVMEGFTGYMESKITQRAYTSEVNSVAVVFEATPGKEPVFEEGDTRVEFDGREVFDFSVNWGVRPRVEIVDPRIVLDYDYGVRRTYHPFDFPTLTRRVQLVRNGFDAVVEVEAFFRRHRGQQREFYFSNPQKDLTILGGIVSGSNTVVIENSSNLDYIKENEVKKVLSIKTESGQKMSRIKGCFDVYGEDAVLLILDTPWSETSLYTEKASFAESSVFASDVLTTRWLTDSLAELNPTIRSVQDFSSEQMTLEEENAGDIVENFGLGFAKMTDFVGYSTNTVWDFVWGLGQLQWSWSLAIFQDLSQGVNNSVNTHWNQTWGETQK